MACKNCDLKNSDFCGTCTDKNCLNCDLYATKFCGKCNK